MRPALQRGLVRKLRALSWGDRVLLVEAVLYLAVARLLVLTVPFARLAAWWGLRQGETPRRDAPSERSDAVVRRVRLAVARVAGRTPWESKCLAQALAAAAMLRRRGVAATLYLGARRDDAEGLVAHAWLRVGDAFVTGARGHRAYGVVGVFSSR